MKSIEDIVTDYLDVPSKDIIIPQEFEDWVTKAVEDYAEQHMDDFIASGWAIGSAVTHFIVESIDDYLGIVMNDSSIMDGLTENMVKVYVASRPAKSMTITDFQEFLETFPAWQIDLYEVACRRGHTMMEPQLGKLCPEKIHDMWCSLPNYVFTRDGNRARGDWA